MIHIEQIDPKIDSITANFMSGTMQELLDGSQDTLEKIERALQIVKTLPIQGCITGSVFLPGFDPDRWGSKPDIDIFVYSEEDLIKAVNIAEYVLKMTPGKGTDRTEQQERWKLNRLYESGINYKLGITTYTFYCDGIMLNFTYKMTKNRGKWIPITNTPTVLMSFDMSIVMQGYDIASHVMFDLRPDNIDEKVAIPNPLRKQDCMIWTVDKWIRQFDRVVKYYERGFDTRPMAQFYLNMIDQCIDTGNLFDSSNSKKVFETFSAEFIEKRTQIANWLEEHKED